MHKAFLFSFFSTLVRFYALVYLGGDKEKSVMALFYECQRILREQLIDEEWEQGRRAAQEEDRGGKRKE